MAAPLFSWTWENLGAYKYLLYAPLVAEAIRRQLDSWCLHILLLCAFRGLVHQLWFSFESMLFLTRSRRIRPDGVDFRQIDREWNWDDFLILHGWIGAAVCYMFPALLTLPRWDIRGFLVAPLLHMAVSEPVFYWVHRALHGSQLFDLYHFLHHSSPVPQSFTASFATPLEHLILCVVAGAPLLGACLLGTASAGLIYAHILIFDFLRCMGHSNVEVFPPRLFKALPFLRYLIYTPTYHSIHHAEKSSNFCLFMPLFDLLAGTLNGNSWQLQEEIASGKNDQIPDFVFLAHVLDVTSCLHVPFVFRSFSSIPFTVKACPYILVLWPPAFLIMIMMWAWSKTFLVSFYYLRGSSHQLWVVPRYGFQYFLPFAKDDINNQIEMAIIRADKMGVKVLSLAALNKVPSSPVLTLQIEMAINEALNGGGLLFVNKHSNLKVRVVHGNTLTAAVILNKIPDNVDQVFLTGATSKLGRAIALYLCRKKKRVLMLTPSTDRFQAIQEEAPKECRHYLVHVTKYQTAQHCKTWIVGKWLSLRHQRWAPAGTHFHQFVVPPVIRFRSDCTYGELAAMRLPEDVQGLGMCEYTMKRGEVHACHAGGVVHLLEGWKHHEVGAIDVGRIDVVWEAALKHGLRPV